MLNTSPILKGIGRHFDNAEVIYGYGDYYCTSRYSAMEALWSSVDSRKVCS